MEGEIGRHTVTHMGGGTRKPNHRQHGGKDQQQGREPHRGFLQKHAVMVMMM